MHWEKQNLRNQMFGTQKYSESRSDKSLNCDLPDMINMGFRDIQNATLVLVTRSRSVSGGPGIVILSCLFEMSSVPRCCGLSGT